MGDPVFLDRRGPFQLGEIAAAVDAVPVEGADTTVLLSSVAPLDQAGRSDLSFLDNPRYVAHFAETRAGACIVASRFVARAPQGVALLVSSQPYRSFARAAALFFPDAMRGVPAWGEGGQSAASHVHQKALLEDGVTVEPGAVIGAGAQVGRGSLIAAGAVIGREVCVGRDCYIGPGTTLLHALVGNRVIIHAGVRIGQDGFGFAMGPQGHLKVPQIGRVVIQDDVEIGANTTIDRGATRDTIIGEGTKIDNLVQIGHNVVIGRHCVIVAQTGISGSCEIGDFVAIGGQAGLVGHVKVGMGAQIAATSRVKDNVPAGARWGGSPAKPVREWFREVEVLRRIARDWSKGGADDKRDGQ